MPLFYVCVSHSPSYRDEDKIACPPGNCYSSSLLWHPVPGAYRTVEIDEHATLTHPNITPFCRLGNWLIGNAIIAC